MRSLLPLLIFIVPPLPAQERTALARAAATITARDVMSRIGLIAADSMQGRATPSPGLERTAEYVASEFRRVGLTPAGEDGGYLQRFRITRWIIDSSSSALELTAKGRSSVARLGRDARYIAGRIPDQPLRGPALLINATGKSGTLLGPDVRNRVVLLLTDYSRPLPSTLNDQVVELARAGPTAVLVLSNRDSATFAERLVAAARPRVELDAEYERESGAPVLELHERAVGPVLAALGIDPVRLRASGQRERRSLPALSVEVRLARRVLQQARVPNVVATLEGSDPLLKKEYLVYSAHIDHIGISPGQPDSVNNGADDNASGVAGLLELAEAFTQPGMRPKRSIMFLAPSAEEPGLLGSSHFTEHPPVPLADMVAN
ncbi:MAG TPA: M20/M25/M40 family metallo-hydrolase, partial [Gemmatimonadales bacterium]|nr:M20/M25/M40 family metallo-hydrolase [Gemmatimonadales bacterium]